MGLAWAAGTLALPAYNGPPGVTLSANTIAHNWHVLLRRFFSHIPPPSVIHQASLTNSEKSMDCGTLHNAHVKVPRMTFHVQFIPSLGVHD